MNDFFTGLILKYKGVPMILDWIRTLKDSASGKKTYMVGGMMILHALTAAFLAADPSQVDTKELLEGLSLCFLRAGIAKV